MKVPQTESEHETLTLQPPDMATFSPLSLWGNGSLERYAMCSRPHTCQVRLKPEHGYQTSKAVMLSTCHPPNLAYWRSGNSPYLCRRQETNACKCTPARAVQRGCLNTEGEQRQESVRRDWTGTSGGAHSEQRGRNVGVTPETHQARGASIWVAVN